MKRKILVAPLNWGIGHATRCVPIINQLLEQGFEPVIASDGDALNYLEQEFPQLKSYILPSYDIKYSHNSFFFKLKLLSQIFKIKKAVAEEYKVTQQIIREENIKGIISDNRFGVRSNKVKSVYLTHQINVFSGITTFFTSKIHQQIIKKFDEVWVPDVQQGLRLSGDLSKSNRINPKFIGVLSRFQHQLIKKNNYEYDVLVLLSGTEPQRTILEKKLIKELSNYPKKILFVRGLVNKKSELINTKNISFINFLNQKELNKIIIKSELVIARSGYSTIMDLAVLQKKCFFIPTPNQAEQEYLASHLEKLKIAPFCKQNKISIYMLEKVKNYTGFIANYDDIKLSFDVFNT